MTLVEDRAAAPTANLNDDIGEATRLRLYRTQLEIREAEQRAFDLFLQNLVKGTSHLSLGQEAVAAGFAVAMKPGDLSFCTYRGHAHTLARGVAAIGAEAEIARPHRGGEARRHRLLAEGEVTRALDEVLQEQVERALLGLADLDLGTVELEPHLLADIVVGTRA
jgi:TPP-dependent pyruvate/acetoin dehydrogenase alpha subunit